MKKFVCGALGVNCYLLEHKKEKLAVIIDPGMPTKALEDYIEEKGYEIPYILLTHGHGDHIGGVPYYRNKYQAKVLAHQAEEDLLKEPAFNHSPMMPSGPISLEADRYLVDGNELALGDMIVKVLATPGHTQGGVCYLVGDEVFTGDTLFQHSIGRTDLYGGNTKTLLKSIKEKLYTLPGRTKVYPGHGPSTLIKEEIKNNPFTK